ncbi:FG-GAP repeat domain-containing protein [Promethearchaeum syntrophicum]|uniref:FG-GAP repeat domain-containing protein n=1 Tax=Promethearchaeum syntrophicum TaxID=2594042 RepID=A0AC61ZU51_9ARCH
MRQSKKPEIIIKKIFSIWVFFLIFIIMIQYPLIAKSTAETETTPLDNHWVESLMFGIGSSMDASYGDIDGDGNGEIVCASGGDLKVYNPNSDEVVTIEEGEIWARSVVCADFDLDGIDEFVFTHDDTGTRIFDYVSGSWEKVYLDSNNNWELDTGDIDNDGILEIIGDNTMYRFNGTEWNSEFAPWGIDANPLKCSDIDHDGNSEVITFEYNEDSIFIYSFNGTDWNRESLGIIDEESLYCDFCCYDLDGDDYEEIIFSANGSIFLSQNLYGVWENSPIWETNKEDYPSSSNIYIRQINVGKIFNSDTNYIVIKTSKGSSESKIYLLEEEYDGNWSPTIIGEYDDGVGTGSLLLEDIDNDQELEIISTGASSSIFDFDPDVYEGGPGFSIGLPTYQIVLIVIGGIIFLGLLIGGIFLLYKKLIK